MNQTDKLIDTGEGSTKHESSSIVGSRDAKLWIQSDGVVDAAARMAREADKKEEVKDYEEAIILHA